MNNEQLNIWIMKSSHRALFDYLCVIVKIFTYIHIFISIYLTYTFVCVCVYEAKCD